MGLASESNKPRADWTTEEQIERSLVDPPSDKFSGVLADIISILWNPFDCSTPSLLDDSGSTWKVLRINHDLMFEKIIPNLLRNCEKFLTLCTFHL